MRHLIVSAAAAALVLSPLTAAIADPAGQPAGAPSTDAPAPAAAPAPATPASATPASAPPAAEPPPASAAADAGQAPAATDQGPVVAWVKHTKPPMLVNTTSASAMFGMIGAAAAISSGHDIVEKDGIEDPSHDLATRVAAVYAAAHGGHVADAPILSEKEMLREAPAQLAREAGGAQYVIDVDPPGMTLIYFSFDWTHYDLMFADVVRVIDASSGKMIASGKCFLKSQKAPDAPTQAELLADSGALLKTLIAKKSAACLPKLLEGLKLAPPAAS